MRKGFAGIYLIIIIAIVAVARFGYSNFKNRNISVPQPTPIVLLTPSPSPSPSPTPTPKPIVTKKPGTPSPKPTTVAVGPCDQFKPADGLATLTITLKEKDGKPLAGDWTVKIKPASQCPGILPPMWGSQISDVVRQPTYTYTSPGLGPGKFRVDINYHLSGEGFDWDGTSGNHSKEITVSN